MILTDYIYKHYRNSQRAFADAIGRSPQMVGFYIKQDYRVIDGSLVDVKFKLPDVPEVKND